MVKMNHPNKSSDRKILEFVVTEDSVEMQLIFWIRDLVNCTNELVPTLERLRNSYRLLRADMPVTDAEEILWRVEQCLKDAEVSSLLGLAWLRGPKGASPSPRGPGGTPA
jgi:hypothetical protein